MLTSFILLVMVSGFVMVYELKQDSNKLVKFLLIGLFGELIPACFIWMVWYAQKTD